MQQQDIAALGRTFHVGQLYDARRDMILAESLWDYKTVKEKKVCRINSDLKYYLMAEDTQSNKVKKLNIGGSLELSFCAGLIDVSGSAEYLKSSKSSEHVSRVTLMLKSTQKYEEISSALLTQVEYGDVLKRTSATHVVSKVDYGYNAFFVFDRRISEDEDREKIHGNMAGTIQKMSLSVNAKASGELLHSVNEETSKFYCKFYGDFSPPIIPTTYEDAVKMIPDIPKLLGISGSVDPNSAIGKPQRVHLFPVSQLKGASDIPRLVSIEGSAKVQIPFLMQYLSDIDTEIEDLVDNIAYPRFKKLNDEVRSFQRAVASFKEEVKNYLKTEIPTIRSGDKKESDLAKFLSNILENSPFSQSALGSYMRRKKNEASLLVQALKNMNIGSTKTVLEVFPGSKCDLAKLIMDSNYKFVFCFVFNVHRSAPLAYLESLEKFRKTFKSDENFNSSKKFPTPEDDKEWFDHPHAVSKYRHSPLKFLDLVTACSNQKDVVFAVTSNHKKVESGDPVTLLYVDGELVCKDFNVPLAKPSKVMYLTSVDINWSTGHFRWLPLENAKEYIIWRDEDKAKIQNHTASKMTVSLSDVKANMVKYYDVTQVDVGKFRGYIAVSAVWDYGILTDSEIVEAVPL